MSRKREIKADEMAYWMGLLLNETFDVTGSPNWQAQKGRSALLAICSDIENYPDDYPHKRAAELLLLWADKYIDDQTWSRLKARLRKRRERLKA